EPVHIRLAARAAAWALARPGLALVERSGDGGAVVAVQGASEDWATRFALSFGGDAEVLSPPAARRHFGETVKRALARY
ncbi:MAG: WYL domain-containing protein, partial [Anaeromyxobacteraceae bacterium]